MHTTTIAPRTVFVCPDGDYGTADEVAAAEAAGVRFVAPGAPAPAYVDRPEEWDEDVATFRAASGRA